MASVSHRVARTWLGVTVLCLPACLWAQTPTEGVSGPTAPTAMPLSGLTPGNSVTVEQTTTAPVGSSVNVLNSTVAIQGTYRHSVPSGKAAGAMELHLSQCLAMGLRANLGAITESNGVQQAEGQRAAARSQLMPLLNAGVSETFEQENLKTVGLRTAEIPEKTVFNYYDARARLQATVFDLVKLQNLKAASAHRDESLLQAKNARDLILLAVGGSYLQLAATAARIDSTRAEVRSAQAVYQQAADRFSAGLAARLDVTRSQVQMQTEQQQLRSLEGDLASGKLRFARLIGLPPGQVFTTGNELPYAPQTEFTQDAALARALSDRSDVAAAEAGVRAAQAGIKAAHAEHLPSLTVAADAGAAGVAPTQNSIGVYNVSGLLTVPIFEGGRIHAEEQQAQAVLKQRNAELADAKAQVDQDVREAFIQLSVAEDQVRVAGSNVELAHETLEQSTDRFKAGVTDTVEVVQAQQAVVQADNDLISATFEHNLAKLALARAMGKAEQTVPLLLREH